MKNLTYLCVVLIFVSCYIDTSGDSKEWDKGGISNENAIRIEYDGIIREYVLHVPDSYDSTASVPLVFNFHGGGGTATGQMYLSNMDLVADTAGFIIAYPQGSNLSVGGSHWNSMIATEDNKSSTDDIGFISFLIDQISSEYNIDLSKVYACGFSNGADFSISLACYLSNKISAVAPVSGLMSSESDSLCNPQENTKILIFNGTSDNDRPYAGIDNYYLSVESALRYWSTFHNADSLQIQQSTDSNGNEIENIKYFNDDGLLMVEHYKIIDGGHYWFDLNYQNSNVDQIIWNFFLDSVPN